MTSTQAQTATQRMAEAIGAPGSLLVRNIGTLVTNRRVDADLLGVVDRCAVAIVEGTTAWVGDTDRVPAEYADLPTLDAEGRAVVPGFVDAHTHAVFAGDRSEEFSLRVAGATYEQILASGGGIHATVRATRAAGLDELVHESLPRFERMLSTGTTTVEVKTGYGLDVPTERRILDAILEIADQLPIDVVPTFLGAHVVPLELAGRREEYVELVTGEMLESVAGDVRFVDVFCDDAAFTIDETRAVAKAAHEVGLPIRLHVDQLSRSGGAALAAELGATSADHVDHATNHDLAAMADAGVVAVLLPGVSYSMRLAPPHGRRVWDSGVVVAIATDCNPGTSYTETMPFIISLAVATSGLTVDEAVWAATRGGALALGLRDRGILEPGAIGDLVLLAAPSHTHLAYRPDSVIVDVVVKRGRVV
jgi:imidazolonepropionase